MAQQITRTCSSIDAITSAAGVAKGSFYNHFDARDDLFEQLIESTLQELLIQGFDRGSVCCVQRSRGVLFL